MSTLKLYVFGSPRLEQNGIPLKLRPRKALALFVYLSVTAQPHSRDTLATLFWPESDHQTARSNLRRTLHQLTKALPPDTLLITFDRIGLHAKLNLWVDTAAFQVAVTAATDNPQSKRVDSLWFTNLAAAIDLYAADFLAGFTISDSPAFDDWQYFQQEELRHLMAAALEALTRAYAVCTEWERALVYALRWLSLDPLREPVHQWIMKLYAWSGQPAAALRQYRQCERTMNEALGSPPGEDTIALFEAIKGRRLPLPHRSHTQLSLPVAEPLSSQRAKHVPSIYLAPSNILHNLPPQPTPFIGRSQELNDIRRRLLDVNCRLLTLVGPGGIGKTRLAIQAAQALIDETPSGEIPFHQILFVELTSLRFPDGILPTIAKAANLTLDDETPLVQQIVAHLRPRTLLILDNFEHLLAGADLISHLLAVASEMTVLITSREALNIQEEWFHLVAGMQIPPTHTPDPQMPVRQYDAVRLFEQSARRTRVGFSLAGEEPYVLRICRLTEGNPLAIELTVSWLKVLTVETVAAELARGLDILVTRQKNVPDRHRSMRVVLEHSWKLLQADEVDVMKQLSVFRGGFRYAAAAEIANASLMSLASLVDKSLLRITSAGRYQVHELLRQFAAEKLADDPNAAATHQRHSQYYLSFVQAHEERLVGAQQQAALHEIEEEIENIRIAWDWALAHYDLEAIALAALPLYRFYWTRSRVLEIEELFTAALAYLQDSPAVSHAHFDEAVFNLTCVGYKLCFFRGDLRRAHTLATQIVSMAGRAQRQHIGQIAYSSLGVLAGWQANWTLAEEHLHQSLVVSRQTSDRSHEADLLREISLLDLHRGHYIQAEQRANESLTISRASGRPDWIAWPLDALGTIAFCAGNYRQAQAYHEESLANFEKIDHRLGISLALGGLGRVAWARGEEMLPLARAYAEESILICRKIGHRLHLASRLSELAQIFNDLGQYDNAQIAAQEGLVVARESLNRIYLAHNLWAIAETSYGQRDFTSSLKYIIALLLLASQTEMLPALVNGLYHYGMLLTAQCDQQQAPSGELCPHQITASELFCAVLNQTACWSLFHSRARLQFSKAAAYLPAHLLAQIESRVAGQPLSERVDEILQQHATLTNQITDLLP
jgi:predicted ATPase/DNA-binding SARP family transcriptional activator